MDAAETDSREQDPRIPVLDIRDAAAFRRGHCRGAVHRPARRILEAPYLLPPRHRRFLVVSDDAGEADAAVARFRAAGWAGAESAVGSAGADWSETGPSRGRLWEPAEFLAEIEPLLPRFGRALDLACGSGRNTVFLGLASQGSDVPGAGSQGRREVLGVDILPDALGQARKLRKGSAPARGQIRFRIADLSVPRVVHSILRPGAYDVITCFRYLDRGILDTIAEALRPGGMLVYETFLVAQREAHGKPSNPAYLLEPGELRSAFADVEVVRYREAQDRAGNFLASLLARRPAN